MSEWYGGQNKYGLKRGDIWSIDNKHRIMCGDMIADDVTPLFNGVTMDAVYTDPPWNSNIATQFYKHAGYEIKIDIDVMIPNIVKKLSELFPNSYLVVEFGNPCFEKLKAALTQFNGMESNIFTSFYGANIPYSIWVGAFGKKVNFPAQIDTSKGKKFTKAYVNWMAANGMKTWCDPFVGLGAFFKEAVVAGLSCHGVELNPNKLALLLEWAEKKKMIVAKVN